MTVSGRDHHPHEQQDGAEAVRVGGRLIRYVLSYVEKALGSGAAHQVRQAAALGPEVLNPEVDSEWYGAETLLAVADAAARVCGDPEIGRRAGEHSFYLMPEVYPFLVGTGSIQDAVSEAVGLSSRSRTQTAYRITERNDRWVTVVGSDEVNSAFACGMSAGFWSMVPSLFGAVGLVTHPRCFTRGDGACEFQITWTDDRPISPESVRSSRSRRESLISRFEQMHTLAAELAAQRSLADLLHMVAQRAAAAVAAPAALTRIQLTDGASFTLGWHGFTASEAHRVSAAFEDGAYRDDPSALTVEVQSARRAYGHIIVLNRSDATFRDHDRRMLAAFALFATASIEAASALEAARKERDTAEVLLGLARVLAEVGTTADIAQRIAEAMPDVVRCHTSSVLMWNPEDRTMTVAGSWPEPPSEDLAPIRVDDTVASARLVETLQPVFISQSETQGYEREVLTGSDIRHIAAAPIVIRGRLVGMVAAVINEESPEPYSGELMARIDGLADHAASALDNSQLLDEVRHQALHDALTGLPNRTLAEDRVRQALITAERRDSWVTLLFVDLDGFKAVNDRFGHTAGDRVLQHMAERLSGCVRSSDTVSRLGGDEFLVVLGTTNGDEDGEVVAQKILAAVRAPVPIRESVAEVSASIGIASAAGRETVYEELLRRADQAMYQVKSAGGSGWARAAR